MTANVYILNPEYANPEDGQLAGTVTENFDNGGMHMLELDNPIDLPVGPQYSVVEEITYHNLDLGEGPRESTPGIAVEMGVKDLMLENMIDELGQVIGVNAQKNDALAEPGESFIYGLNGTYGESEPIWQDVTDPDLIEETQMRFRIRDPFEEEGYSTTTSTLGNVMIKAYTTFGIGPDAVNPTDIALDQSVYNLSTIGWETNSLSVSANLEPVESNSELTWSVSPESVATVEGSGATATLVAVGEGEATLTVTTGNELSATAKVVVSNDELVCDGVEFMSDSSDSFAVLLENLRPNPAIDGAREAKRVSIFAWSEENQGDINAKVLSPVPGTNDWIYEQIPVNDNEVNNYFINATSIHVNVYASSDENSDGSLMNASDYS